MGYSKKRAIKRANEKNQKHVSVIATDQLRKYWEEFLNLRPEGELAQQELMNKHKKQFINRLSHKINGGKRFEPSIDKNLRNFYDNCMAGFLKSQLASLGINENIEKTDDKDKPTN